MSSTDRMFDALEKEITTDHNNTPAEGITGQDLQAFETRITNTVSEQISGIQEKMLTMIDEKLNKAITPAQPKETKTEEEPNNGKSEDN